MYWSNHREGEVGLWRFLGKWSLKQVTGFSRQGGWWLVGRFSKSGNDKKDRVGCSLLAHASLVCLQNAAWGNQRSSREKHGLVLYSVGSVVPNRMFFTFSLIPQQDALKNAAFIGGEREERYE